MSDKKTIRAGFWYIFSNFLVKGIVFITMPIFTRVMTKSDVGIFANVSSWFNILAIITSLELYSSISISRFDFKKELNSYISSTLFLGTVITFIFYIFVLIFHTFFEELFTMDFTTLNIIFIYLLVYPAFQMYQLKSQINYDYKKVTAISIVSSVGSTMLSLIFVLIFKDKLLGRVIGHYVPLILLSLVIYIYLLYSGKSISKKYWKYALKISIPLVFHLLSSYLLNSSDKIMITKIVSPEATAMYSVAYSISMIVSILWSSMNNAWSPWAYEQMDLKKYDNLKTKSKPYFILFLCIVYPIMLITPELLLFLGGKPYLDAKYVMPPVMVGCIFQFVYSLYVNIEFYHKKQKNIAFGTIIAAIVNIILNNIFIPIFGYIAAAHTTLVGYIVLFVIHYYFVNKMNCNNWYDTKFFIKLLILSLCYMFTCNLLYSINLIRYIIIIVCSLYIIFFIIKNYKELIIAVKSRSIEKVLLVLQRKKAF